MLYKPIHETDLALKYDISIDTGPLADVATLGGNNILGVGSR